MNLAEKIKGTYHKWRYNNVLVNGYYSKKREELLNESFLKSNAYDDLMTKYSDSNFNSFINDAEERTKNFQFRHMRFHKILGGWRWKGLWQHKNELLPVIFDKKLKGIDFGGANGPVSLETTIVDFAKKDSFNREVKYNSLDELDFKPDFIFSSHTLEHIEPLDEVFSKMKEHLTKNGKLFFLIPSHSCKRWRVGVHTNKKFNDHTWTFCLKKDEDKFDYKNVLAIDEKVAQHFNIVSADYVGDNSIFIMATNK